MKHGFTVLCAAGTALVLAAGFLLPGAYFSLRDGQLTHQVTATSEAAVVFQKPNSLIDMLSLFADGNYSMLQLDSSFACMTAAEAEDAAITAVRDMQKAGFVVEDPADFPLRSADAYFVIAGRPFSDPQDAGASSAAQEEDAGQVSSPFSSRYTAVLWSCSFSREDGSNLNLMLDDATGMVYSINFYPVLSADNGEGSAGSNVSQENRWTALKGFAEISSSYFAAYYGLQAGEIEYGAYPSNATIVYQAADGRTIQQYLFCSDSSFGLWIF